jgi:phage gp36-like protein
LTYGQIEDVKERLHVAESATTRDAQIQRALNQADALIDLELSQYTTVPLTEEVSNIIVDVANDWATGIVQEEIVNPTSQGTDQTANIFVKRAKLNLARYIEITYESALQVDPQLYEQPIE